MPGGTTTEVTGDWMTLTDDGAGNYELTASPIDDTLVGQSPLALQVESSGGQITLRI